MFVKIYVFEDLKPLQAIWDRTWTMLAPKSAKHGAENGANIDQKSINKRHANFDCVLGRHRCRFWDGPTNIPGSLERKKEGCKIPR